jgi:phosphate transport system permease protein
MAATALPARRSLHTATAGELRRRAVDRMVAGLIYGAAGLGVAVLLLILAYVVVRGAPAINFSFFTERPLPYGEVGGGVFPAIAGTVTMLLIASLIALPVGMGTAIYLSEYGRGAFAQSVRFVLDVLAGMPSIVIGVFVWALVVRHAIGNYAGLAGAVALSIIMIPVVTRTVEEILRLVPDHLREASLALGVPRWLTILRVVLPTAKAGVITGVMLSLARAGGETAPLLLTALGNQFLSFDVMSPMASLPVQIYNYAVSPYDDWHTKAWGSALVLVGVIGVLSLTTRIATRKARMF